MPGQYAAAARLARRGIPVAIELYRRWQHLTPEQRERYLALAKQYAQRAGDTARQAGDAAARQAQRRRGGRH